MLQALRWVAFCSAGLLSAPSLIGAVAEARGVAPLSVQACDTQCQSRETDCDLACDQVVACVEQCKKASEMCVQRCRAAPAAPAPGNSSPPPKSPPPPASSAKLPGAKKPPAPVKAPAKPAAKP